MRGRRFETAAEKRGLLSASGFGVDFKRLSPLALRSRRSSAASLRAVTEKIDSLLRRGGDSDSFPYEVRTGSKTSLITGGRILDRLRRN
jgi:hypothetical protein